MILGQYNLVLFGIKWYWVNKGLLCLYILKKLMVTPTDQPTDRQCILAIVKWIGDINQGAPLKGLVPNEYNVSLLTSQHVDIL